MIIFLYCYFADYLEQVNIWLVAQGDDPIDFGSVLGSKANSMTSQMRDLYAEQADRGSLFIGGNKIF